MHDRTRFLVVTFGCSLILLLGHFALMRVSEWFAIWVTNISLGFLGYLREVGLPTLDRAPSQVDWSNTAEFPYPTNFGQIVILVIWWLSYFVITLLVTALIRLTKDRGQPLH
jgi:hypothetical protein